MLILRSFLFFCLFFWGRGGKGVEREEIVLKYPLHYVLLRFAFFAFVGGLGSVLKYKLLGWLSWLAGCISELWRRGRWPTFIFTQR